MTKTTQVPVLTTPVMLVGVSLRGHLWLSSPSSPKKLLSLLEPQDQGGALFQDCSRRSQRDGVLSRLVQVVSRSGP